MKKDTIKIKDLLKVQAVRTKEEKYIRIAIPVRDAKANDIKPGDLVKINIEKHIKVGRE